MDHSGFAEAGNKKKRDRQSGGQPGGLALPDQIRDGGIRGWVALIQLPSFEGGGAQLATVLRDNGTNALALDGHPCLLVDCR